MTNERSALVAHLPTRDYYYSSSTTATGFEQQGQFSGGDCYSIHGIATDTSNPSVMTEKLNAGSDDESHGFSMTSSQLLLGDTMMGHERVQEEAFEAQLLLMEPESPSCSIRTERTTGLTDYCKDENARGHNIPDIDANEAADVIEMSQHRRVVDKEDGTEVYGGIDPPPPPLPTTSIPSSSSSSSSSSENKNLKEYLSQFRQLSKSERRKLLSEVKNILDVGDKSMIGGVDDGRNYYYARKTSDEMQQDEDDSLLASSEDDGTAMDSRVSSYYSDTSTAFYTNDVSTAICGMADTRTSMYSTADSYYTRDDDNNRARYARKKYARGEGGRGGGIGKRRVGKAAACLSSRERKTNRSRLYQDMDNDDDDNEEDEEEDENEESLVALMNFPCMSYLLCDFKRETKEANISDQDSWDWNKSGMMKKRADEVQSKKAITVKRPGNGDRNVQSGAIQVQCGDNHNIAGGKCSPSFSVTSQNGLTVKERMEKMEEKLTEKKSCAGEEPTTAGAILEKLSGVDDATKESAEENTNPNSLEVDQAQNIERSINRHDDEDGANLNDCRYERNDRGVVISDGIPSDDTKDIISVVAKDMDLKLAFNSQENESKNDLAGAPEVKALSAEVHKMNKFDHPILDKTNGEVGVVRAKSFSRQRSGSPFIKTMATLSRKSPRLGNAVEGVALSQTESTQRNEGTGVKSVAKQRSASPFLKAIPHLPRKTSGLNNAQLVDESIIVLPAKVSEQADGTTYCNKSSTTEVSDESAEMVANEDANGGISFNWPEILVTNIATETKKIVSTPPVEEQQQELAESPIEMVHQKPPRVQKKRFNLSLFCRKKKIPVSRTHESPTCRPKKQSELTLPASPEITVRSVESCNSPTLPSTPTKFEYHEKTELADVMYVALRDSPVSTDTTSSSATRKKRRGWKEYTDLITGKKYYSDGITTTWIRPVNFSRENSPVTTTSCNDTSVKANKRGAKKGWREYIDRNTGKQYYSDGINTSWENPMNLIQ